MIDQEKNLMNRLQDRIAELSKQARESGAMQKEISFYKYVAQIEFNAWHYTGDDLWAGLVEHIFAKLEIAPNESMSVVKTRTQPLYDALRSADLLLKDASSLAAKAQERFDEAERAISCLDKKHRCQLKELEEAGYISRQKHGRTKLIKLTDKFFEYFDLPRDKLKDQFKDFGSIAKAIESKEQEVEKVKEEQKKSAEEAKKEDERAREAAEKTCTNSDSRSSSRFTPRIFIL